ncbi:MAG TPA: multicopper oxidase domain-containing protein [Kofleriaceae bacterium]|nr:multicopper oxidase domain-containing protein [Kofleriaceae bacterium]
MHTRRSAVILGLAAMSTGCDGSPDDPGGQTRRYFIAAEQVEWDYAPHGNLADPFFDEAAAAFLDQVTYDGAMEPGDVRIGTRYQKSLYRAYTDESFTIPVDVTPESRHLGALGPTLYAEVGDTIEVVFRNDTPWPANMHPHGVSYDKANEGAPYDDGTAAGGDDRIEPGESHLYVWGVPERAGPPEGHQSSMAWMYHSHVDEVSDTYAGLMGTIVVTARGMARPDGRPSDVDRELTTLFHIYNEGHSPYLLENLARYTGMVEPEAMAVAMEDEDFEESNLKHSINGRLFANLGGLTMRVGETVRWYVMAMGTEVDVHTPHWHAATLVADGMRFDTIDLLPAAMIVADMVPDEPGSWLYHCHVNDHLEAGMMAVYEVRE